MALKIDEKEWSIPLKYLVLLFILKEEETLLYYFKSRNEVKTLMLLSVNLVKF